VILGQRFSGKQNNGAQRRLWVWHGKCPYCDATLVIETLLAKAYPAAVSYSITTFQVRGDALLQFHWHTELAHGLQRCAPRADLLPNQGAVWENSPMTGVQFVTDSKGRKVAVLIDLKKHGARLRDFWDGLVSESRRAETGIPLEKVKADLVRHGRLRG